MTPLKLIGLSVIACLSLVLAYCCFMIIENARVVLASKPAQRTSLVAAMVAMIVGCIGFFTFIVMLLTGVLPWM